jgi:hypothetical protein
MFLDGVPKGAIARVAEVDGTAWVQHGNEAPMPLKPYAWIYPGDIVLTDGKTVAAIEFPTGRRVGINKDTFVRFDDADGHVEEIPDPTAESPTLANALFSGKKLKLHLGKIWDKINKRPLPLEIETAGGVMGCKG